MSKPAGFPSWSDKLFKEERDRLISGPTSSLEGMPQADRDRCKAWSEDFMRDSRRWEKHLFIKLGKIKRQKEQGKISEEKAAKMRIECNEDAAAIAYKVKKAARYSLYAELIYPESIPIQDVDNPDETCG